jgi:hypothetical protein
MRVLHLVLHLRRLVHLTILNLGGNPLNPVLQELWDAPAAGTSRQQQAALSGRQAAAAAASRVKDRTQAVLQHLLEQQVCWTGTVACLLVKPHMFAVNMLQADDGYQGDVA